jgi:hypothetical protein
LHVMEKNNRKNKKYMSRYVEFPMFP